MKTTKRNIGPWSLMFTGSGSIIGSDFHNEPRIPSGD